MADLEKKMEKVVAGMRATFDSSITLNYEWRMKQLGIFKAMLKTHHMKFIEALSKDMSKPFMEADLFEVTPVEHELKSYMGELKRWMTPESRDTPMLVVPAYSEVRHEPYGVVLVIAPFNYPFQLALIPVMAALAAGNCVVLKPSELTPHTSALLEEVFNKHFDPSVLKVIPGGVPETTALLAQKWDMIFFTGSAAVAKIVHQAASKHLTPCVLELGGKSPVIVDKSVHDIDLAARRILWGKMSNAGQTCIAPDYALVHKDVREALVKALVREAITMYTEEPKSSLDIARIVNAHHTRRLKAMLDEEPGKIAFGGEVDVDTRYVAPTIIDRVKLDTKIMNEEVFGPILPVVEVEDMEEAIRVARSKPTPLALYIFAGDKSTCDHLLDRIPSGGACLNDTLMQFATVTLPFGGVGASGMGTYHGRYSYETFTHKRAVSRRWDRAIGDITFRYPPYNKSKHWIFKTLCNNTLTIYIPKEGLLYKYAQVAMVIFSLVGIYYTLGLDAWVATLLAK